MSTSTSKSIMFLWYSTVSTLWLIAFPSMRSQSYHNRFKFFFLKNQLVVLRITNFVYRLHSWSICRTLYGVQWNTFFTCFVPFTTWLWTPDVEHRILSTENSQHTINLCYQTSLRDEFTHLWRISINKCSQHIFFTFSSSCLDLKNVIHSNTILWKVCFELIYMHFIENVRENSKKTPLANSLK